jgi:hypothetical protein
MASATFTCLSAYPCLQIRKRDIPMRMKRVVHTGPKTQLGGLKDGFCMEAYQVGIEGVVNREPANPAPRQMSMLDASLSISGDFN